MPESRVVWTLAALTGENLGRRVPWLPVPSTYLQSFWTKAVIWTLMFAMSDPTAPAY